MRYTFQEKTRQTPVGVAEAIQQRDQPDPVCCRAIHSSSESMADTIYPLQAPPTHNYSGNQRDTKDNVLPATSRTLFPQQLNKLQGLHTQLAKTLIQGFLRTCTNRTRAQLIFTTHDLLLMDCNDLLRRDEIWITDKSIDGESTLIGLPEYRGTMHDEDIRKSYLEGRFGGTPQLDSFTLEK